jgi:peptidoglycan/xylan/chitin deacetylase (PgdA/CDA1 family)
MSSGAGGAAGSSSAGSPSGGAAGTGTAGASGQGGGVSAGPSGLPVPPGDANVPKPAGNAANLKVVPWAGFKAAVSYTFDDSQPSQFEHWPELKAAGVPLTYFITTNANYITDYDKILKEVVSEGGELGNHTVNHCNFDLSGCTAPLATPEAEMDQCSDYITKTLGQPDTLTIAYPYGDGAYANASKTRFFLGRGVGGGLVAPGDNTDPFSLPVVAAVGGEAADVFSGHIDDAQGQGRWLIFLFHSLGPTANAWYATVDIGSVTGSIEHAKSLSDVWIDSMANVGAYWLGQKLIQGAGPQWSWTLPAHFPTGKVLRVTVDGGTLKQGDQTLSWDGHGYYEVALDAGMLSWTP